MENDEKLLQDVKRLMIAKYSRFGAQIASVGLKYSTDLKYHTAATDGKNIYFDPDFLASLSDEDRLFIIAHELMHVKFEHMYRIMDKDGKKRDPDIWNRATDAIINANLERDGFKIKEGYVNIPEALTFSSEELYDKLLREKQEQQQQNAQGGQGQGQGQGQGEQDQDQDQSQDQGQGQSQGQDQDQSEKPQGQGQEQGQSGTAEEFADDHSLWEKAFEERQEQKQGKQGQPAHNEESEFQKNRDDRRERIKHMFDKMRNDALRSAGKKDGDNIGFGDVGEAKPILNWKLLLRREVERAETIWSQRRSLAENNYAYRLEENEIEDQAETEVMIDVSGSVSLEMVKAFLRQLKPLLKESKLKVGCFNEQFWGMQEIKSIKDIDNFKIPAEARGPSAWTEDWDLAVRSFSKKREVNKIVFTDGEPCPGTMPQSDLRGTNVLWLVYSNRDFNPCCGKVIDIYESDLQNMIKTERESAESGPSK